MQINGFEVKTWMVEQLELLALLILTVYLQRRTGLDLKGWTIALTGAAGVLVAQKVRSGADRQAEQNELAGVKPARLRCSRDMQRLGLLSQVLSTGTSILAALTWGHVLVILWTALYPIRRKIYRSWKPASLED